MLLGIINALNQKTTHLKNNLPPANASLYTKQAQRSSASDTSREQNHLALRSAGTDLTIGQEYATSTQGSWGQEANSAAYQHPDLVCPCCNMRWLPGLGII